MHAEDINRIGQAICDELMVEQQTKAEFDLRSLHERSTFEPINHAFASSFNLFVCHTLTNFKNNIMSQKNVKYNFLF